MKRKLYIIVFVLVACTTGLFAQRQTKSPFSRFGYGEMYSFSNAYTQAMGGIGVGVFSPVQIHFANPANQSSIQKESFLFNVGLGANVRRLQEESGSATVTSVGLETMSLAFPIIENRWGCAVGILPFNSVGYDMNYTDSVATYSYSGNGGINQVVLSTGVRLFKGLSVGANAAYLFGTTSYTGENTFKESSAFNSRKQLEYKTLGFLWNAGIQYKWQLNETKSLTFGATMRTPQQLTYRETQKFGSYVVNGVLEIAKDTVSTATQKSTTDIPMEVAFGVSFAVENALLVGVDAGFQNWGDISCYGKVDADLQQTKYVKFGGEIIPNYKSTKFYQRIPIRLGVHYSDLPIMYQYGGETEQLCEYGISLGTRIKPKQNQNGLAIALDFGRRGNSSLAKSLQETYMLLKLNVTLQEVWFMKRKIN